MTPSSPARTVEVLRATLLEVEQTSGVPADDPAMIKLKDILVRRIADVEAERAAEEALRAEHVSQVNGTRAGALETLSGEIGSPVDPKASA